MIIFKILLIKYFPCIQHFMSKGDDNYETILQRFNTNREKLAQYKTGLSSFMKNYEHLLGDKDKEDVNFRSAYNNNTLNDSTQYNLKFKSPILSPRERKENLFDNIDNALTRLKKKYNFFRYFWGLLLLLNLNYERMECRIWEGFEFAHCHCGIWCWD